MNLIRCPNCGFTMQTVFGSNLSLYYECIECGYGEYLELEESEAHDFKDYYDNLYDVL